MLDVSKINLYLLQGVPEFHDIHDIYHFKWDFQVDIIIARDPEKEPIAPAAPVSFQSKSW